MVLTDSEYREFKKVIQNYFEQKNKSVVFTDDYTLGFQNDSQAREMYNLTNLAKICKRDKKENWNNIISEFYDKFET